MSKLMISLLAAAGIAFSGGALAAGDTTAKTMTNTPPSATANTMANAHPSAPMSRDAYRAAVDRADADYKVDKDRCSSMTGNAKDICVKEAKGKEKIAKADAEAAYKNTDKARYDARMARADADYDVAKEKCDDLKGNDKDVCVKEAKATYAKSKADAKVTRTSQDAMRTAAVKTSNARQDAAEDKRDADYKVAKEKCDALSGAAKDQCVQNAKARYGKS